MKKILLPTLAMALSSFVFSGCFIAKHIVKKDAPPTTPATVEAVPAIAPDTAATDDEPSLRNAIAHAIPELKTINFAYDSARLSDANRDILAANAAWLNAHPEAKALVTGNCDQRGTVEYNLALGQRRARAVRDYYLQTASPATASPARASAKKNSFAWT